MSAWLDHDWFMYTGLKCCKRCGFVWNRSLAQKPCSGQPRIMLRDLGNTADEREAASCSGNIGYPTDSAQDGMTEVWFQNLVDYLEGTFPIDDKWRIIFLNQLQLLWIKAAPKPEDPNWHKLRHLFRYEWFEGIYASHPTPLQLVDRVERLVAQRDALLKSQRPGSTNGPFEARACKGMPADCIDFGVVSLTEKREVCRVWLEQDARAIADLLNTWLAQPETTSAGSPIKSDVAGVESREWLIRKNGYFYRPNFSGYTGEKVAAGRYTKAEAEREAAIEPENFTILHESEVPDAPQVIEQNGRIADLEAALVTAREALEAARAEILQSYRTYVMDDCDAVLPPGRKPAYDKQIDAIAAINALSPVKMATP